MHHVRKYMQDKYSMAKPGGYVYLFVFAIFLLAACNPSKQETAQPVSNWTINLEISGGFAGLRQTLTLDQSGQAIFIDKRKKSRTEKKIISKDLQIYADLVKNLAETTRAKTLPNECRDCINYALVVTLDSIIKRRAVNTISLTKSDAKELISKLASLAAEMRTNK